MYSIFKECFHRDAQITGNNNLLWRQKRTIHLSGTRRGRGSDMPVLLECWTERPDWDVGDSGSKGIQKWGLASLTALCIDDTKPARLH